MQKSLVIGTVLPDSFSAHKLRLYCKNFDQLNPTEQLALIVHEAYHIQQYLDLSSRSTSIFNWGFNRCFIRLYIAWYLQNIGRAISNKRPWRSITQWAYRTHPLEVPAYAQEEKFRQTWANKTELKDGANWNALTCPKADEQPPAKLIYRLISGILCLCITIINPVVEFSGACISRFIQNQACPTTPSE